jgi:hypothetical protein
MENLKRLDISFPDDVLEEVKKVLSYLFSIGIVTGSFHYRLKCKCYDIDFIIEDAPKEVVKRRINKMNLRYLRYKNLSFWYGDKKVIDLLFRTLRKRKIRTVTHNGVCYVRADYLLRVYQANSREKDKFKILELKELIKGSSNKSPKKRVF